MRAILAALATMAAASAFAATLSGQVQGGGAPIASSTVTLWAASPGAPKQLAQVTTGADGRFTVNAPDEVGSDSILYVVAKGGTAAAHKAGGNHPAIALLSVLGPKAPQTIVVNELTTVASVFTAARFIDGEAISGHALGLRIAAGNAPNLVDPITAAGARCCSTR
jgi:hypothetical protein